jgi:hypothetical protein
LEKQNYFTLDAASQKIPWLETQLEAMTSLTKEIERLKLELDNDFIKVSSNGHGATDLDSAAGRKEIGTAINKLRTLGQEINDSGIILRDLERGLVDFPTLWEDREVYLCWLLGESSIQFWHEIDTGFSSRQSLV